MENNTAPVVITPGGEALIPLINTPIFYEGSYIIIELIREGHLIFCEGASVETSKYLAEIDKVENGLIYWSGWMLGVNTSGEIMVDRLRSILERKNRNDVSGR